MIILQILNEYFEIAKFHEKLSKAQKNQREYNEKQKGFNVEDKLQKLRIFKFEKKNKMAKICVQSPEVVMTGE